MSNCDWHLIVGNWIFAWNNQRVANVGQGFSPEKIVLLL